MVRVYLMRIKDGGERGAAGTDVSLHARQSAAARTLLAQALARDYPQVQKPVRLEKDGRGKPFLPEVPGLYLSLSHSGSLAACALGERAVGVDVEVWKSRPRLFSVARKFHPRERELLAQADGESEQERLFCDLWTRKESFLKAAGEGLRIPLDVFSTVDSGGRTESGAGAARQWTDVAAVRQSLYGEAYYLRSYRPEVGCSLAVCAQEAEFAPEVVWIGAEG